MSNQIDVIINELLNNLKTTFISTNNNERNSNYKKWFQSFRKEIERKYTKIFNGLYLCEGIIDYFSLFYQFICI